MVGFKLQLRLTAGALTDLEDVVQLVMFNGGYVGALVVESWLVSLCWVLHEALLKRIGADWSSQAAYFARSWSGSVSFFTARNHAGTSPSPSPPFPMATFAPTRSQRTSCPSAISSPSSPPSPATARRSRSTSRAFAAAQAVLAGEGAASFQRRLTDRLRPATPLSRRAVNRPFDRASSAWTRRCGSAPAFPASSRGSRNRPGLKGFDDVIKR